MLAPFTGCAFSRLPITSFAAFTELITPVSMLCPYRIFLTLSSTSTSSLARRLKVSLSVWIGLAHPGRIPGFSIAYGDKHSPVFNCNPEFGIPFLALTRVCSMSIFLQPRNHGSEDYSFIPVLNIYASASSAFWVSLFLPYQNKGIHLCNEHHFNT